MEGKEELAATLQQFAGAVLLVTHDRTLMEQSCNRYWLIDDRQLSEWHDLLPIYTTLSGGGNAELVISLNELRSLNLRYQPMKITCWRHWLLWSTSLRRI